MKHSEVKRLVNSLNDLYDNYVEQVFDGRLPKALEVVILNIVASGGYKTQDETFKELSDALCYYYGNGHWEE